MTVSSERGGQKAQVKRKRQINPERKEKAYQQYLKRNKTKTCRNRLANERYSELSLTVSNQIKNHSKPGLEASGDPEPNSSQDDTVSPSNMPAQIDDTPVGVFTPDQPIIKQPTGGPLPEAATTSTTQQITWSNRHYKKLELYPHMLGKSPNC
jgi:hypothetical protein